MRTCRACTHPDRTAIDQAIIAGESNRAIATRYQSRSSPSGLSPSAVDRHRRYHLAPRLAAIEARREAKLADLVAEYRSDLARLLAKAEKAGDLKSAISCVRELTRLAELGARQTGELRSGPGSHDVNVQVVNVTPARSDAEIERDCRLYLMVIEDERRDLENAPATGIVQVQTPALPAQGGQS
jgi:hypothetical protein